MTGNELGRHAFHAAALSPAALVARAQSVYADHLAYVDEDRHLSYAELVDRSLRLGGVLAKLGLGPGDVVSVLAPNTNMPLETHLGLPSTGMVLNALNTRLSAPELRWIMSHAGTSAVLVDSELESKAREATQGLGIPVIVDEGPGGDYDTRLYQAQPLHRAVEDEWGLLSINYTSGTTGRPKGVMYAHRGAYLQALAMMTHLALGPSSVFLWTLPMFHCNGWCFPWAVTAAGGTHVGLRRADPEAVWKAIGQHGVTHLNAAPTVLTALAHHEYADAARPERRVRVATGGAPPTSSLLDRLEGLGFAVTHLYGLTETYGPAVICETRLGRDPRAHRQGVANVVTGTVRVLDESGAEVPADGRTVGEVVIGGNNVMMGYLHDPVATSAAMTTDGCLRTGDLGVMHPDGYLELTDRAKDVIISGGENVASVEVERVLAQHPAVLESAVVGQPDPYWGEVPVAFVTVRTGCVATEDELIDHVRDRLAHFKAPRKVVFTDLPKSATGKIQKYDLRQRLRGQAHKE